MCSDCGQNYCRKCLQIKVCSGESCPVEDCFPIKIVEKIEKEIKKDMDKIKILCTNDDCKTELNLLNFFIHDKIECCLESNSKGKIS